MSDTKHTPEYKRTPYENGYSDAMDRGMFASGDPGPGNLDEYLRGYGHGESELEKKADPAAEIAALRTEVERLRGLLQLAAEVVDDSLEERPARHSLGSLLARIREALSGATK